LSITPHISQFLPADWYVVHEWHIFGEARMLIDTGADTTDTSAMLSVYSHIGNRVKVDVGYELDHISQDLADIDYIGQGAFLNIVAKFQRHQRASISPAFFV